MESAELLDTSGFVKNEDFHKSVLCKPNLYMACMGLHIRKGLNFVRLKPV